MSGTTLKQINITEMEDNPNKGYHLPVYQDYHHIIDNIQKQEKMPDDMKFTLMNSINKVLDKQDHIEIIKIILETTNKKVYTSNLTVTMFDLQDLSSTTLWKLHYFV